MEKLQTKEKTWKDNGHNGRWDKYYRTPELMSPKVPVLSRPMAATDRVLIVLMENGGLDLKIDVLLNKIFELVPVMPSSLKSAMAKVINDQIIKVTDNWLESAELALNNYAKAKPSLFSDIVVLRDGTASYEDLKKALIGYTAKNKLIDLFILTHGSSDYISVRGGIDSAKIRAIKTANEGKLIRLRTVYQMNCVGGSLNPAWLDIGAKAVSGASKNNYLPEPTMYFFWRNWQAGQSFQDSVINAYKSSISAIKTIIKTAITTVTPGGSIVADPILKYIDVDNWQFIKDSAPQIDGNGSVKISSDELSFSKSLTSQFSVTVVPRNLISGLTRQFSDELTISSDGIKMIKMFEGFRAELYNDAAGHCTVGYGTLVHKGKCDGSESEKNYLKGVTEERAAELLLEEVEKYQEVIRSNVKVDLSQNQFDSLLSLVYNIGPSAFKSSTLLKKLNEKKYSEVPAEIRKWDKATVDGKKVALSGLTRRRKVEAELFENGVYAKSFEWVRPMELMARGIRNNNPGNIKLTGIAWDGKVPNDKNTDGTFEQFEDFHYGVRALILMLINYIIKGRDTITKIITHYAPATENKTKEYIAFVSGRLGIKPDESLLNEGKIERKRIRELVKAIARFENGVECISDEQFEEGFKLLPREEVASIQQSFSEYNYAFESSYPSQEKSITPEEETDENEFYMAGRGGKLLQAVQLTTQAVITTTDVKQEINIRLLYLNQQMERALLNFKQWDDTKNSAKIKDLDSFAKFLRGKASVLFSLAGPAGKGASIVYDLMNTAIDASVAQQIKDLQKFVENMIFNTSEKLSEHIRTKIQSVTDAKLKTVVGAIDQTRVNTLNHSQLLDEVVMNGFDVPDYSRMELWPDMTRSLIKEYLTYYWDKVASKTQKGIMLSGYPGLPFEEVMHYFARESLRYFRITPMATSDTKFQKALTMIKNEDWNGIQKFAESLTTDEKYAMGQNPDLKKAINDSDFNYIKRGMLRAIFYIN